MYAAVEQASFHGGNVVLPGGLQQNKSRPSRAEHDVLNGREWKEIVFMKHLAVLLTRHTTRIPSGGS
jgi:hypothetical protein